MRKFKNWFRRKMSSLLGTNHIKNIHEVTSWTREILGNVLIDYYLKEHLFQNEAYAKSKRLTHFHKSVFTQNGEDGIIEEIFKRIGCASGYFVEFGVHGVKNNSTFLLVKNWRGLWIGADKEAKKGIDKRFGHLIAKGRLVYSTQWITVDNIENIFRELNVPEEFDFLSIDIDGNDYWVWQAIENYFPRVVCIEYNATYPPDIRWVMTYNARHNWEGTSYFGASLRALEDLGRTKGYVLVGCDFAGCNAFFVRKDQNLAAFEEPFTAINHYEPPRYFLRRCTGHKQGFGPFESDL